MFLVKGILLIERIAQIKNKSSSPCVNCFLLRPKGCRQPLAEAKGFEPLYRLLGNRISSAGRYNHFDTLPYFVWLFCGIASLPSERGVWLRYVATLAPSFYPLCLRFAKRHRIFSAKGYANCPFILQQRGQNVNEKVIQSKILFGYCVVAQNVVKCNKHRCVFTHQRGAT